MRRSKVFLDALSGLMPCAITVPVGEKTTKKLSGLLIAARSLWNGAMSKSTVTAPMKRPFSMIGTETVSM